MRCLALLSLLFSSSFAQDDAEIKKIRAEVAKAEKKFTAMSSKYRVIRTVSKEIIKETERKSHVLAISNRTVDGIWHGEKYSTHMIDNREMGDGSKLVRNFIATYNGKMSLQNVNFKIANTLNDRIVDGEVNPRLIALPLHLGRIGSLREVLNIELKKLPFGSGIRYWKNVEYKYLGEEKIAGEKCHKIEIIRRNPKPPNQPTLKHILWIAPQRSWQVAASECHYLQHFRGNSSSAKVTKWKKLKDAAWIPQQAEIKHFELDKLGNRRLTSHEQYQLINCKLKCDPKDKRFDDAQFRPGMETEFFDIKDK